MAAEPKIVESVREEVTELDLQLLEDRIPHRSWAEVEAYLDEGDKARKIPGWMAGEHWATFAPTKGGKSHLIRYGLLPLWWRYPVLWLRFKARDDTTPGFGTQVDRYPIVERIKYKVRRRDSEAWETDPEWFLLQLPSYRFDPTAPRDRSPSWANARRVAGEALDRTFQEGGWVDVIDEIQAVTGNIPPALDLGPSLENALQRGRTQPLTLITASQQPAWNSPSVYDQARFVALGKTLDEARFQRIGELGGSRKRIEMTLPELKGPHPGPPEFVIVDRYTGWMAVTSAPPIPTRSSNPSRAERFRR